MSDFSCVYLCVCVYVCTYMSDFHVCMYVYVCMYVRICLICMVVGMESCQLHMLAVQEKLCLQSHVRQMGGDML